MMQTSDTRVVSPDPRQALNAVRTLRGIAARLGLPDRVRSEACGELEQIEKEIRMPDPDRGVVTAGLERFTEILASAGVDMTRRSLIRSIRQIAVWLGPIGVPLVARLA
jgi:transcription initiation factor TFIIIB Brf1 subunit/transcription initiation factor TFIIB